MQERFFIAAKFTQKLHHIIYVILSLYALVHIVCGSHHVVFTHRLLNDLPLLHTCHKAVVNAKRYSVPVCKVSEDSRFFC